MRKKYYKDDLIEILNGEYQGSMFYVTGMVNNNERPVVIVRAGIWPHPQPYEVRLCYRPLKNHIKHLINMLLSGIKQGK